MSRKSHLLMLLILLFSTASFSQSLITSYPSDVDTTGMSASELLTVEEELELTLASMGSSGDTLVVELGPSAGSYDLFRREFALSQTGTFDDGCSLDNTNGLIVGLGKFTGIETYYVRAYLKSAGVSTAVVVSN